MSDIKTQIAKLEKENQKLKEEIRDKRILKLTKNKKCTPKSLYWLSKDFKDIHYFSKGGTFGVEVIPNKLYVYLENTELQDWSWEFKGKTLTTKESTKECVIVPKPTEKGTSVSYEDFIKAFKIVEKVNLNRILFSEDDGIIATDSRRLINIKIPVKSTIVLPIVLLNVIAKLKQDFDIIVNADRNVFILFKSGYLFYKITDSDETNFPMNWRNVIPEEEKYKVTLDRDRLYEVLKEFNTYVKDEFVKVIFKDGFLQTHLFEADTELSRDVGWDGPEMWFNFNFLLDAVENVYDDTITVRFKTTSNPALVDSGNMFQAIMPLNPL